VSDLRSFTHPEGFYLRHLKTNPVLVNGREQMSEKRIDSDVFTLIFREHSLHKQSQQESDKTRWAPKKDNFLEIPSRFIKSG
jgi:hypothetical protein